MKIKKDLVLREIAGDYVLVPTRGTVNEYNGLFTISPVAARIWELLPDCADEKELCEKLLSEYDVDEATLSHDVSEFLTKLSDFGFIERSTNTL